MLIGSHVSPRDPIDSAEAEGADCVQIFVGNPQSWKPPTVRDDAQELRRSSMPVYVHAPYLINVVSGNEEVRAKSSAALQQTCDAAGEIGAGGVVVHGGHVTRGGEPDDGVRRWVEALESLETDVPVLLENTAGGSVPMTRHVEDLGRLWDAIGPFGVGYCLDTCHAHAAGESLDDVVDRTRAAIGAIDLVHCNDSRDEPGSGRDRHEHLGKGSIDPDLLVEVVRRADAPVIIETAPEGRAGDIVWLRERL